MWLYDANVPSTSSSRIPTSSGLRKGCSNVFDLLARRELAPRARRSAKSLWGDGSERRVSPCTAGSEAVNDARLALMSWVEAESLQHFSTKYCPLLPPPRSTIASAFSPDGKMLASTHGDHTVKIIDSETGICVKDLCGHRRTPWVVRFHPRFTETLASGSLDNDVRLWNVNSGECIGSRDFYRPIASIAFHAEEELLAVASGHKLYMWHYNRRGQAIIPTVVLKTRRSIRAVHFHPHATPFLLTAEVNDLESSDSSMTIATSQGYLQYPPPTVYFADTYSCDRSSLAEELPRMSLPFFVHQSLPRDNCRMPLQYTDANILLSGAQQKTGSSSRRILTYSTPSGQYELLLSPVDDPNNSSPLLEETAIDNTSSELPESGAEALETAGVQPDDRNYQFFPFGDPASWELPFLQGWLIGQSQAENWMMPPPNSRVPENPIAGAELSNQDPVASSAIPVTAAYPRGTAQYTSAVLASRSHDITSTTGQAPSNGQLQDHPQPVVGRIQSELATTFAAVAATELPCTVKLRIWQHDIKNPSALLVADKCRLIIPYAVLCSEMGAHFSPCGRFLAACVACMLPNVEGESGIQTQPDLDLTRAATSPTRHPISAHRFIYELRIYSLEEATFGSVLASRAIRAAHCLTSIQFSPTSEHLLLAYGRRHGSLLRSIVIDGEITIPIYSILEVYRVADMELVRVLPDAEDEVNVASFHPEVGGGLAYGTKEGKLRILKYDRSQNVHDTTYNFSEENMLEMPTNALEC